jgi:hypothetical protein
MPIFLDTSGPGPDCDHELTSPLSRLLGSDPRAGEIRDELVDRWLHAMHPVQSLTNQQDLQRPFAGYT